MAGKKCVAYVSTYTMGDKHGIRIYDVDMEHGRLCEKGSVHITNSSYVTISHNRKYLYAITDTGVSSYRILPDGNLEFNEQHERMLSLHGLRGQVPVLCRLSRWKDHSAAPGFQHGGGGCHHR